jgi:hydroxypyruvate isomerase
MRYDVNLSILFTELPLLRRAEAARSAGFGAVEFWWPFDRAVPSDSEVDAFVRSITDAGVSLAGLNFFAGDMAAGDRGLVSWPGREREFADSVEVALGIADQLGCRTFNALYGNRIEGHAPEAQDELALSNLDSAAVAARRIGATLVIEPLSGTPRYPLRTAADALAVIDKAGRDDLALLFDLYHLGVNGDDLDGVIDRHLESIGHVQIADVPGRHQPGTGSLDIQGYLAKLAAAGYDGYVGLEYAPSGPSDESFEWLPREER